MERVSKWYSEHFGFIVEGRFERADLGVQTCTLVRDAARLELFTPLQGVSTAPGEESLADSLQRLGWAHVAFAIEDFDDFLTRMRTVTVEDEREEASGTRHVFITDPKGNKVEVREVVVGDKR